LKCLGAFAAFCFFFVEETDRNLFSAFLMSEEEQKFAAGLVSAEKREANGIFGVSLQRESLTEKVSMSSPQVLRAFFVVVVVVFPIWNCGARST
jgi:hypothetical protein